MNCFRTWTWAYEYEDFTVACTPDGVYWSADMAYYAGKPSQPSCMQSLAEFLKDGAPAGYDSIPANLAQELHAAAMESLQWQAQRPPASTN